MNAAAAQEAAAGLLQDGSAVDGRAADRLAEDLGPLLGDDQLAAKVSENFERYQALAGRDRENMARLTQRLDEDCVVCVPYFDEDVHDVEGLAQVNAYLFGSTAERQEVLEGRYYTAAE
jgi:hypothetical protein